MILTSTTARLLLLLSLLSVTTAQSPNPIPCSARPARGDTIFNTTDLTPVPINVTLQGLPAPYSSESVSKGPQVIPIPEDASLQVPQNFSINVFETGLTSPRWLALTPTGEVLVTETDLNQIAILVDTDNDGVADVNQVFANPQDNSLNKPFGMVIADGSIFIANTNEIRRYNYTNGARVLNGTGQVIANLPGDRDHWTRNLLLSADNTQLYVAIGASQNVGIDPPNRAVILTMNLDGTNQTTFVSGIRNPVGLGLHPITKDLYAAVQERDLIGDDLVPDYFTRVERGQFFGWPYAYLSPDNLDPRMLNDDKTASLNPELASTTVTPDVLFAAHSAVLGIAFSTNVTFTGKYSNGAFAAFHGSWNRNEGTGYKIVWIPFGDDNRPLGYYEDFVTGFLYDPSIPSTWGRPTGTLFLNDGSLIFTDDNNGNIYRVQYQC